MGRLIFIITFTLLTGCASSIVKHPAADKLKNIAFVSVYTNSSIYDVNKKSKSVSINVLKKMINEKNNVNDENIKLSVKALKHYSDSLSNSRWQIVPQDIILNHKAYKAFVEEFKGDGAMGFLIKLASSNWAVPPGMVYIPYEAVANKQGSKIINKKATKARLAKLSKELQVDGVAILYVDLAYKKTMISVSGTSLFSKYRGSATPAVASEMVIVNRKGEIAVLTPSVKPGAGKRYFAKNDAPMIVDEHADLTGPEGEKALKAFDEAIKNSAKGLKNKIKKELG